MGLTDKLNEGYSPKKDWMEDHEFRLVTSASALSKIIDVAIQRDYVGLDLETEGFDNRRTSTGETRDRIVGYCLSYDESKGYYIPVRHVDHNVGGGRRYDANVSPSKAASEFKRLVQNTRLVFHNARFDQEFLAAEIDGIEFNEPDSFEDTLILDYLRNSSAHKHGLKFLSKDLLDRPMLSFGDVFDGGSEGNFGHLDPTDDKVVWYAGADAINTLGLYNHYQDSDKFEFSDRKFNVYWLEKKLVPCLRWMDREGVQLDRTFLENINEGQPDNWNNPDKPTGELPYAYGKTLDKLVEGFEAYLGDIISEIEEVAGRRAKWDYIKSNQKLGKLLEELQKRDSAPFNVKLNYTESGDIATDEDEIDRMVEKCGDDLPFLQNIQDFRSLEKAKGFAEPLLESLDGNEDEGDVLRFEHRPYRVESGRFSGTGGNPEDGFADINIQQLPACYNAATFPTKKIHSRPQGTGDEDAPLVDELEAAIEEQDFLRKIYDGHFIKDNSTEEEFCVRESCEGCPFADECEHDDFEDRRFLSVDASMRKSVTGRDDYAVVAIDYSGVELRTAANLSNETKWIEEFYRCGNCGHEMDELREKNAKPPRFCPNCDEDAIGDLHTLTAKLIWGSGVTDKPDFKMYRQKGKATNFAIMYGGGSRAVGDIFGEGKKRGKEVKNKILGGLDNLQSWMNYQVNKAYDKGHVTTGLGRKIRFDNGGEYRAVNSIVQGTATGDVTRLAMAGVYKAMLNRGAFEDCQIIASMHDEIVFEIHKDRLDDLIPVIRRQMTDVPNKIMRKTTNSWPVPLQVDVEVGQTWDAYADWDKMHHLDSETGKAKEPVPEFLRDHVEMKEGMYYEGEEPVEVTEQRSDDNTPAEDQNEQRNEQQQEQEAEQPSTFTAEEGLPSRSQQEEDEEEKTDDTDNDVSEVPEEDIWTYQTSEIVHQRITQRYMMRLQRVTKFFKKCYTDGDKYLRVEDHQGKTVLSPRQEKVKVDPQIFLVIAEYEGV